jgi:predicted nucleic acid-binding protein
VGTIVLDASVVIGLFDTADAHHGAATSAISHHASDQLSLPASAYSEVLVRPSAAGAVAQVRDALAALAIRVDPIDEAAAEAAARLRARHPALRLPDALVIGLADAIDADAVLTTDERWQSVSRRVRRVA